MPRNDVPATWAAAVANIGMFADKPGLGFGRAEEAPAARAQAP